MRQDSLKIFVFTGHTRWLFFKDGNRDYINDTLKDSLWNIVKILFPSNNGQLETITNADTNFGKYVANPKVVALLLNYTRDFRAKKKVSDEELLSTLVGRPAAKKIPAIAGALSGIPNKYLKLFFKMQE